MFLNVIINHKLCVFCFSLFDVLQNVISWFLKVYILKKCYDDGLLRVKHNTQTFSDGNQFE